MSKNDDHPVMTASPKRRLRGLMDKSFTLESDAWTMVASSKQAAPKKKILHNFFFQFAFLLLHLLLLFLNARSNHEGLIIDF